MRDDEDRNQDAEADAEAGAAADESAPEEAVDEAAGLVDETIEVVMETWLSWLPDEPWIRSLMAIALLAMVAWFFHLIAKRYVVHALGAATKRLPSWWAREVVDNNVLFRLVPLVPVIIIGRGIAFVPHLPEAVVELVQRLSQATVVLLIALAIGAVLNVINIIYNRYPISKGRPIKGYLQVAKLIIYIAAGILIVSALMAESPWVFLTGLGAMMAVILLIFRDTLLSLVAGIQLVNNDLIRVGDWIEMPQFNADGDVIDISLHVVQVRNWDKTVTSIPTHKFLEHSFKNWRGMFEAGGRRIKRPLYVDMTTIRFLTEDEIRKFSKFRLLKEYIETKVEELGEYNRSYSAEVDAQIIANARHLSNIGTFRAYIREYLNQHSLVNHEMTMLVRQLDPGPHGLPLELFLYIKDTRFIAYENAQSDIFDHLLAIAPEFGLRIFQEPSGHDLVQLRRPQRTQSAARNGES